MTSSPFTDPSTVAALYADTTRTQQRTGALLTAKTSGDDATNTIVDLAARHTPDDPAVCEIGCGRGTVALALADKLTPARLTVVDLSEVHLATVARRAAKTGFTVNTVRGDFHQLPLPDADFDVIVAAFCLYHSPRPHNVIAEIARCLAPDAHAVLATKSADSYREIDQLMADTGLDPHATTRPSLYQSFHSHNAADITATALAVDDVIHRQHVFRFDDFYHLAAYAATIPKYQLPQPLTDNPSALATELRRRTYERPIITTSTVTYLTGKQQ
jgi:ubiquinone/menaquinone biosynthesis C-methylase UbiE